MTIFEKIIKGEIPAYKIYEDAKVLAFLDINPENLGHTLLIPKAKYTYVWDMSDEDYQYLMAVAKKLAVHLRDALGTKRTRLSIVGKDVPYAHVHLVPFDDKSYQSSTLQLSESEFQDLVEKLRVEEL